MREDEVPDEFKDLAKTKQMDLIGNELTRITYTNLTLP